MLRALHPSIVASGLVGLLCVAVAEAQIVEFDWTGGPGTQDWQVDSNWAQAGFPNDPEHIANLSAPRAGNLAVDLATGATVAGLNLGVPNAAVATEITGATLRLQNDFEQDLADADFSNNSVVDGRDFILWQRGFGMSGQDINNGNGDADGDMDVDADDLAVWQQNYGLNATGLNSGRAIIRTSGLAGTVNRITADVRLGDETAEVVGQTDLIIDGGLSFEDATPVEGVIGGSISNTSADITTTLNGPINITNAADGLRGDFGLNTSGDSQGKLVVNGVIDDGATNDSDLYVGVAVNNARRPLNTVRLNAANTYSGGTKIRRANVELGNDAALGTGTVTQAGPANQFGYNLIAVDGPRTLANDFTVSQWQTFKGSNSFTLTGGVTQTNNRGFVNQLDGDATLTMTGLLEIWEDDEALIREFEFDGEGTTIFTGTIRDDPELSGNDRRIRKSGTGVLVIDVDAGNNTHSGPTVVDMGNLHYSDNASLNTGGGMIVARGGAVGVDTGVANNAAFAAKIDPQSTGGFMLAASDAAGNLNFTTTLANAGNMTVAAPETGLTYTGTITPANSTYGLGGGTGTLTLPNAQLTGNNSVEVRNGGVVELLGDNTYTGSTTVITKYSSTHQEQAEANSSNANDATGLFYDRLVSPTLVVDDLADGGSASSIGAASSDASNILLQGATLKYVGAGDATDRLFTIGTGGATLDASGTGAVVFSNAGLLGRDDAEDRLGDIDDFTGQPNEITDVGDTSDIIIGMSANDPDPGGFHLGFCEGPNGENCIPTEDPDNPGEPVVITGISDDGSTLGLSADFPFVQKLDTRIVFGVVDRTLTLAGDNADDNTIASVISDSAAGSTVHVDKVGAGKWILSGANAYSGDTTVEEGLLSVTSPFLDDDADVLLAGGTLELDFAGEDVIDDLLIGGVVQADGRWGAVGNNSADFTTPFLAGMGLLNVGGLPIGAAVAAVPEPASLLLLLIGASRFGFARRRRREAQP